MRYFIQLTLIFGIQLFLVLDHGKAVGKYVSPYLLLLTTLLLVFSYFQSKLSNTESAPSSAPVGNGKYLGSFVGLVVMGLAALLFIGVLKAYPDPSKVSDVMPQLEMLYQRFAKGIPPYSLVHFESYSAYPVYMPLHWLPIGFTNWLGIDARWIGILLLFPAMAIFGQSVMKHNTHIGRQLAAVVLVVLPIFGFFKYAQLGIGVSLETVIVAYYLVLAAGLIQRNLTLITLGIVLILLSRYTFIFWLPTFAYLMIWHYSFKKSMVILGVVMASVIGLYIVPFILKDPSIFMEGINYHRKAVVGEWMGYGNPPISYSMEDGMTFAGNVKRVLTGDMANRVFINRALQAGMLLLTMAIGLWAYHTKLKRINIFDFSLGMLYVFLMIFFIFSPLTYLYYMIVPMVMAAVLVADIWSDLAANTKSLD